MKKIGKGTFAVVYKAKHISTDQLVAIKVLDKKKIEEEKDKEWVKKEIQILRMLRHPNIIQLYEIQEDTKKIYMIMEYAENGELFDLIVKNKRL